MNTCMLTLQLSFLYLTLHRAPSKDIEAVQQHGEVDLKAHQVFLYRELLEDISLESKRRHICS